MNVLKRKLQGLNHLLYFDNGWQLVFARLLSGSKPLLVYRLKGMSFLVDHGAGDENGTRLAIASSMYRGFLEKITLSDHPTVLDLGANGGGFGLLVQSLGYSIDRIVAVEMNPATTQRLRFNLDRNVPGEVVVLNCAVCGKPRTFELELGSGGTGDSIYDAHSNGSRHVVRVEGRSFDDIADETLPGRIIDVCKIDIEGAEHEVLAHPGHERLRSCRYVVMEIHPTNRGDASTQEVLNEMEGLGFKRREERFSEADVYFFENTFEDRATTA